MVSISNDGGYEEVMELDEVDPIQIYYYNLALEQLKKSLAMNLDANGVDLGGSQNIDLSEGPGR